MAKRTRKQPEPVAADAAPTVAVETPQMARARAMAIEAARSLADDKCEEVLVLDVRGLSQISDYVVIGSGTSDRQMRSAAETVMTLGKSLGHPAVRQNVDERTTWYVVDFVDVVVHVFEPNTRAYYDLEMMWGDAVKVDWSRGEGESPRVRTRSRTSVRAMGDGEAH